MQTVAPTSCHIVILFPTFEQEKTRFRSSAASHRSTHCQPVLPHHRLARSVAQLSTSSPGAPHSPSFACHLRLVHLCLWPTAFIPIHRYFVLASTLRPPLRPSPHSSPYFLQRQSDCRVMPTQSFLDKLYDFVDWSSCWPMEGEDDLASYYERFLSLSEPALFFHDVSRRECNKLFWQGFHPNDRSMLSPYVFGKQPNQSPGNIDFRDLFNIAHSVFSRRMFETQAKAEAEAVHHWKLTWEEDQKHDYLLTNMHDVTEQLAKPEPLSEPVRDTLLRQTSDGYHAPSAPSSPTRTPSLPVPEIPASLMDTVASAIAVPVEPSHLPPRTLSPLVAQLPRTPELKPNNCPVEERCNIAEIMSINVSTADKPTQPQSPEVLRQRRLRRHRQNRLRHPPHSLPAYSRTMSQIRRPCYRNLKSLALSAFAPLAIAQDISESVVTSPPLPPSPLAALQYRMTEVKPDNRLVEERRNAPEVMPVNDSKAEAPTQPQSQRRLCQKRLRRRQQSRPCRLS